MDDERAETPLPRRHPFTLAAMYLVVCSVSNGALDYLFGISHASELAKTSDFFFYRASLFMVGYVLISVARNWRDAPSGQSLALFLAVLLGSMPTMWAVRLATNVGGLAEAVGYQRMRLFEAANMVFGYMAFRLLMSPFTAPKEPS